MCLLRLLSSSCAHHRGWKAHMCTLMVQCWVVYLSGASCRLYFQGDMLIWCRSALVIYLQGLDVDTLAIEHIQVNRAPHMRRRTYRAHGRIGRKSLCLLTAWFVGFSSIFACKVTQASFNAVLVLLGVSPIQYG